MTTIQRQIARDVVVVFIVSLIVITMLVMFIGVAREAINQGLGLPGVIRLIPFALPNALSLAVPGTALFSVCLVYGRMSADNEFVALQSVGISLLSSMLPAIAITSFLSIATVGLINLAFTWGFHGIQRVVISSVENIAYGVLERDRNFQHGDLTMSVWGVEGRDLIEPQIKIARANGEPVVIRGRSAQMAYRDDEQALELRITNGSAKIGASASFHFPDTFIQSIPLGIQSKYDLLTAHPSHMPMRDLSAASLRQSEDVYRREKQLAVHTGFSLLTSRCDQIADPAAVTREAEVQSSRKRLHRLGAEMHRRWASGFTCLAMSMIGIPLAIRLKASDTMTTFGIVFLPTILTYYPIFALTLEMAKDGRIAAQGVWIANVIFIGAGIVMMRQLVYRPN
ncbi:MAG: LptF/LptG family permease [Planctomycetales bacterium]|nr:LptF/LptG family permease [Planctomycetales bacterium]